MIATQPRDKTTTKQDYATPDAFFHAVNQTLPMVWDLAATQENTKCANYISPEQDTFKFEWHKLAFGEWLYLNPEFKNIAPYAKKCYEESIQGAQIAMLTPASTDTHWFKDFIFQKALVVFIRGRMSFDGKGPYPKPLMLSLFAFKPRFVIWDWKKQRLSEVVDNDGKTRSNRTVM